MTNLFLTCVCLPHFVPDVLDTCSERNIYIIFIASAIGTNATNKTVSFHNRNGFVPNTYTYVIIQNLRDLIKNCSSHTHVTLQNLFLLCVCCDTNNAFIKIPTVYTEGGEFLFLRYACGDTND